MSIQVKINRGKYRGNDVSGVFPLVRPFADKGGGIGFITVNNSNPAPGTPNVQRITLQQGDFELLDAAGEALGEHVVIDTGLPGRALVESTNYEQAFVLAETDDEAMDRIEQTFKMLDMITDAAARGIVRGLVVSGPPGIGKSFGVEKQLEAANMFRTLAGKDPNYEIVSGGVSPVGLYQKLYHNRDAGRVLVFDDSDGVLFDEESILLLKAALNSGDRRRICWNKESRTLSQGDIPDQFDFVGSILFLSNVDFERSIAKNSRISAHLAAIMSRCHYLDLEIGSLRDQLLRVKQVVRAGMLNHYDFTPDEEAAVLAFVVDNAEHLREVSLRMVKKIADLVKSHPHDWEAMAVATTLQRDAKFKIALEKRKAAAKAGVELMAV